MELRRKSVVPKIIVLSLIFIILSVIGIFVVRFVMYQRNVPTISSLYELWESQDFESVYKTSTVLLVSDPLQNTALAFKGYAAYYAAVAQIDTAVAQTYLDESINSLRLALMNAKKKSALQISYMLGKAYYLKNSLANYHYYADLALEYLLFAKNGGYEAGDIAEYCGLLYASLDMSEESIVAFSEALIENPSDLLFYAIAEQYYKLGQFMQVKQYLFQLVQNSNDEVLVLKSKNILGNMYIAEGNYEEAFQEFTSILEKDVNFADAYYGLGVIYEKQGDMVKARAEWRKALRSQANHSQSQLKLNL